MNVKNMIAVVQLYIFHRKGVEVDIGIRSQIDILKLIKAYDYAVGWFEHNNVKISMI